MDCKNNFLILSKKNYCYNYITLSKRKKNMSENINMRQTMTDTLNKKLVELGALDEKLNGELPVTKEELIMLVNSSRKRQVR